MNSNELGRTVAKGQIANYALDAGRRNHLNQTEIAGLLRETADLMEADVLTEKEKSVITSVQEN